MSCLEAEPSSMLQQHLLHIHNSCAFISFAVSLWILFIIQDFDHTKAKTLQKAKNIQLTLQIILLPLLFALWLLGSYAGIPLFLMWFNQFIFAVATRYRAYRKLRNYQPRATRLVHVVRLDFPIFFFPIVL
ncbi:MAG: hypothetical protein QXR42_09465 [Candidatus Bathyarchaeia archaeon]